MALKILLKRKDGKKQDEYIGETLTYEGISKDFRILVKKLIEKNLTVSVMESCTGGIISSLFTDTEGSSAIIKGSIVTYSNEAKIKYGVPKKIISQYGVYSFETAEAMAEAVRKAQNSDFGIGVTGTLGNIDHQNPDSVQGEIYICLKLNSESKLYSVFLKGTEKRYKWKLSIARAVYDILLAELS